MLITNESVLNLKVEKTYIVVFSTFNLPQHLLRLTR